MTGSAARSVALSVELHGLELTADAPAILLGPALGTTAEMWHPVLPYLTDARVVIYSPRGHGGSNTPDGPYTIAELADDAAHVLEMCGLESAHHAGVSLGGMIALQLAVSRPETVQSVIAIASSAHPGDPQKWLDRAATVRADGMAPLAQGALDRWFTADFLEDPAARAAQQSLLGVEPEGYAGCCEAISTFDLRGQLGSIEVPTLVLAGADDEALPLPHSEAIAAGVPNSELHIVRHSAHLPPTQQPRAVADRLRAFLGLPPS